eukprot:gene55918-76658_t
MRTMSKFGLAGVRIGYLIGRRELIKELDKLRPPFNISVLNAEAGLFALENLDEYARQAALIRSERGRVSAALSQLQGVYPFPSEANMILTRVPDAAALFAGMKRRGVLVKNVSALHPLLAQCLRITIGTPEENDLMLAALLNRHTKETQIRVRVNLDGTGQSRLSTGIGFFDHMLDQVARHGLIDLEVEAVGDLHIDGHHTVEDVGITLGHGHAQRVGDVFEMMGSGPASTVR